MEQAREQSSLGTLADEPSRALVMDALRPRELLVALGWEGGEADLSLPIPVDDRGIVDPAASTEVRIQIDQGPLPLRHTLCSILDRAGTTLAVKVELPPAPPSDIQKLLPELASAIPGIQFTKTGAAGEEAGTLELTAGDELPWGWPRKESDGPLPSVAYLLSGVPAEGSGGTNSVVQEVRGIRSLGASAHICIPASALERAGRRYGNEDGLFVSYARERDIPHAIGEAEVVVATEHTSVLLQSRLTRLADPPEMAYYVQDYEPLFAPLGSARSDRALLSYGALPRMTLFAKTHFLRNVVTALHRAPVIKVAPSLDRAVFNAEDRPAARDRVFRVVAMVRPRTPRRRPRATLETLSLIKEGLGEDVEILTFGCEDAELEALECSVARQPRHLGRVTSHQVAEQLRGSDLFIDCSAYQAFGRSGLEAMACGAVPILPSLGGTSEYAINDRNAIVLDEDDPAVFAAAALTLARDGDRLEGMRMRGIEMASRFSVEHAAASQLSMFGYLGAVDKHGGADPATRLPDGSAAGG